MSGPGEAPASIPVRDIDDSVSAADVRRRLEAAFAEMRKDGSGLSLHQERTILRAVLP